MSVYLCSSYINQTADLRAALLVHEAMHSAGQREAPGYPGYPTSAELAAVVREKCQV